MTWEGWMLPGALALIGVAREAERAYRTSQQKTQDQDHDLQQVIADNAHQREVLALKHENAQLLLQQAHDSDRKRTEERYAAIQMELARIHDKASEHRGEFQSRVGRMELKIEAFIAKNDAQMEEIYRRVPMVGRRSGDGNGDRGEM